MAEGLLERRQPFREAHLTHARRSAGAGHLLLGGAALPEGCDEAPVPAFLAFRVPVGGRHIVEEFAKADPYVEGGLVGKVTLHKWSVMVGSVLEP